MKILVVLLLGWLPCFSHCFIIKLVGGPPGGHRRATALSSSSKSAVPVCEELELELEGLVLARVTGRSAGSDSSLEIERLVSRLEALSAGASPSFPSLWSDLQGEWELKYTNNAQSNPTRKLGLVEITRVLQCVGSSAAQDIENVLCVSALGTSGRVRLLHDVKVTSDNEPAQLAIDLRQIVYSPDGGKDQQDISLLPWETLLGPWLSSLRRGFFDTTFVSTRIRVSRGLLGELRIFTKSSSSA